MSLRIGCGLAITSHLKAGPFLPTRNKRLELDAFLDSLTIGGVTHVATNKTDLRIADAAQTGLDPLASDWSLDFWVNFASVAAGETCFIHKGGNDNTTAGYEVYRNGTTLKAALSNGTTRVVVDLGTIAAATWYHGAVTFDRDGNAIGYLNAVAGTPADISGINTSINSSVDFYVGSRAGADYAGVSWSALRIWNKKLTAAEVTALYGNKNAQYYGDLASTVGLVSNYDPIEPIIGDPTKVTGASATCRDSHGANHLTFTNANVLVNGNFESPRTGITGASFAADDKSHLEIADNAALDLGTGDFVFNSNELRSAAATRYICSKFQDANNFYQFWMTSTDVAFMAKAGGATVVSLATNTSCVTSTTAKYHVQVVVDRSDVNNCKIIVNGVSQTLGTATILDSTTNLDNSGAFTVGFSGGSSYFDGRISMLGIAKPADVTAADCASAITLLAGTGGLGQYYAEFTAAASAAQEAAINFTAFWDLTEASGNRTDKVSSLVLGEVRTVNLVTNGTFADASSWTTNWDGTGAGISGGVLNAICTGDGDPVSCDCYQNFGTIKSGRSYTVTFDATATTGQIGRKINNADDWNAVDSGYIGLVANGANSTTFTATGDGTRIHFYKTNSAAASFTIDNVTVTAASIPCASDADVFGSWTETAAAGNFIDIETMSPLAGVLSARMRRINDSPTLTQAILNIGSPYTATVIASISDESSTDEMVFYFGATTAGVSLGIVAATYTVSATATSNANFKIAASTNSTNKTILVDTLSVKCDALTASNGPSTAIASDSVGTAHAPLSGFTTSGQVLNWVTRNSDFALYFDGVDDNVVCGNLGNVTRISFDVKSAVANQKLLTLANSTATAVSVVAGTLTFGASLTASNITVDGVAKTAAEAGALVNDGAFHTVAFDLTSIAASNVKLGTDSSAFGNVTLDNVSFYLSGAATHTYTFSDGPHGTPTGGSPIVKWISQEGNVYGFDQPTLSKAPTYVVSAQNSRPGLYGDGIDDYLSGPLAVLTDVDTLTLSIICGSSAFDADQVLWATSDTASATVYMEGGISAAGKAYLEWRSGGTTNRVTGDTVLSPDDDAVITWKWTGSAWSITVNRKVQTLTVSGTNTGLGPADLSGLDNFTLFAKVDSTGTVKPFEGTILDMLDYEIAETPLTIDRIQRVYQRKYAMGF